MGKYIRKCSKGVGEVAVMEVAQVGVRTRARAMAIAAEEERNKRRKVGGGELRLHSSTFSQIGSHREIEDLVTPDNLGNSAREDTSDPSAAAVESVSSGKLPASCCSSNGSQEERADLEEDEEGVENENGARCSNSAARSKRREATPTSEFQAESGELESTRKPSPVMTSSRRRSIPAEKMPPAAELEEFFAVAEKELQKRFQDKYNYDIVNDVPLKGRFEWVELKP